MCCGGVFTSGQKLCFAQDLAELGCCRFLTSRDSRKHHRTNPQTGKPCPCGLEIGLSGCRKETTIQKILQMRNGGWAKVFAVAYMVRGGML